MGLVAPPACLACGEREGPDPLCLNCAGELGEEGGRVLPIAGLDVAWAARPYRGVARDLVGALKFRRMLGIAAEIARVIAAEAPPQLLQGAIVPVPADPLRRIARGFDAAELIAAQLARRTALPLERCLRRRRGPRQVGRRREERVSQPPRVLATMAPATALIVDDVLTTGATLAACARALRGAGASEVRAVAFAAGEGPARGERGARGRADHRSRIGDDR